MKRKSNWLLRLPFIAAALIAIALVITGCVSGLTAVGWSGGVVSDGVLYVGSREGRLVAININDDSRVFSEALVPVSQPGLFGCAPATGGGCAGGTGGVPVYGTPVVSGNLTYMAGYNGKVYAYNTGNLAVRWVYPREGYLQPIVGGIVSAQGKLFFGCNDGRVYALDAITGDKLWESDATGDKIWGTPAVAGDTVYIGSFDKKLYAFNVSDGTKKWDYITEGSIIATPVIYKDTVIIGSFDRHLYALNADGTLKWRFAGRNWFWAEPVIYDDVLYVGCLDKSIYIVNPVTGALIAEKVLDSPLPSRPVVVGGSIIFASEKGVIYSLNPATNETRVIADIKKTVNGPLTTSGDIVYIHTQDLELQRVNTVSGALLSPISLKSSS